MGFKNIFIKKKNNKGKRCSVIIVAAGKGSRMKSSINKQYMNIMDSPVLLYTLQAFEDSDVINEIIVVVRQEDIIMCKDIVDILELTKVKKIIVGGEERYHSVYNGLQEVNEHADIIAVHDGARPLIKTQHIEAVVKAAYTDGAAVLGVKVKDTIKLVDEFNNIIKTPDRSNLWTVQTPQVFKAEILRLAYKNAIENEITSTDDSALVEAMGYTVKIVEGDYDNIKITTPEDILFAESFIEVNYFD